MGPAIAGYVISDLDTDESRYSVKLGVISAPVSSKGTVGLVSWTREEEEEEEEELPGVRFSSSKLGVGFSVRKWGVGSAVGLLTRKWGFQPKNGVRGFQPESWVRGFIPKVGCGVFNPKVGFPAR